MCNSRRKLEVDRKKNEEKKKMNKKEKRTDEPQRCITHYMADLLFFYFHFCSFPQYSLSLSLVFFPRFFF